MEIEIQNNYLEPMYPTYLKIIFKSTPCLMVEQIVLKLFP
jgi:hypothetical protein